MADEEKKSGDIPADNPTPIDPENPPEPIKEMQAKTIREIRAETVPPQEMPDVAKEAREAESPDDVAARREIEDVLNKPIEAIEDAVNALDRDTTPRTPHDVLAHDPGDTTNVFGRFTIKRPIYDVVFVSLGVFTLLEVLIAEILPDDSAPLVAGVGIFILLAFAFVKAFHVVYFYMHLKNDDRLFWATLLVPLFIAIVGLIFLAAVPPGYSF